MQKLAQVVYYFEEVTVTFAPSTMFTSTPGYWDWVVTHRCQSRQMRGLNVPGGLSEEIARDCIAYAIEVLGMYFKSLK